MFRILLQNQHPFLKVAMLFCMLLLLMALGVGLASALVAGVQGVDIATATERLADATTPEGRNAMRMGQVLFQLVAFLGAAWVFRWVYGRVSVQGFLLRAPNLNVLFLPFLVLAMLFLVDAATVINTWIIPTDTALGQWASSADKASAEQMNALLGEGRVPLWQLLILSAVLPAVCEEFFFRGALQITLVKATKNVHAGVWITAVLFALTHMQVYGMLPRLLLGGILGYLVLWTGSLWGAIIVHALYNATVLLVTHYFYWNTSEDTPDLTDVDALAASPDFWGWLVGLLGTVAVVWAMRKRSAWGELESEYVQFEVQDVNAYLQDKYGR